MDLINWVMLVVAMAIVLLIFSYVIGTVILLFLLSLIPKLIVGAAILVIVVIIGLCGVMAYRRHVDN
jgi:uncharacterized membrane protein